MRTTYISKPSEVERKWYVVDAAGLTLGRMSSEIAAILRGKNKPYFSPSVDTGDYVIVINADKIKVTGKKLDQKQYIRHSGYVGGQKRVTLRVMLNRKPDEVIIHAVKGMLPKNTLGRYMIKKLFVYAGPDHTHQAQMPEILELKA